MGLKFLPIPSLDYRYEINHRGIVRNARTRRTLRKQSRGRIEYVQAYRHDGKSYSRTIASLLWEVFGIEPKRRYYKAKPVRIQKDRECLDFPSYIQCAKFLSPRVFLSISWLMQLLRRKSPLIEGWNITYKGESK